MGQEKFNVGTAILKKPLILGEAEVHRCDEAGQSLKANVITL
jgi:hypothetical protein